MRLPEHLPADRKHQGAVPLQERGEGSFVPPANELQEQLAVALFVALFRAGKVANIPEHARQRFSRHVRFPLAFVCLY